MAAFDDRARNAEVDRLYQLPLDQFIKSRNELAKRVGGSEGTAVRALAKPNVLAWALNQLYWSKSDVFDRLVAAAARLRATQAETLLGKRADLRTASEAHREAIREALQQAAQILQAAGHTATPDAIRELTGALEALPWKDPGRLVRPPAASGFEALAGLPVSSQPPPEPKPARARGKEKQDAEYAAPRTGDDGSKRLVDARRERAAALKAAREAAQMARREEAQAAARLQRADKQLDAAARREAAARDAMREAERERSRAEEERAASSAALEAARRSAADAARRLDAAERQ